MAENRANIIKCVGLVTHGSELSRPSGSLKKAKNVNVDEDGVMTPRRGFNDYKEAAAGTVKQVFEYKDSIIRHYLDKIEYQDANGDFQEANGSYTEARSGYRTKFQESNSNMYFTTDSGIKKISAANQKSLNADMITNAGGIKAGYASGNIVPTIGGFLPAESKVAYRIVYGTKDASNNLIYGAPSSRFVVTNFSADVSTGEQSSITMTPAANGAIADGDYFNYSTLGIKYTIYFDTTGNSDTIPQTSDTIGTTYVNINVTGNTSNDNVSAAILANTIAANIPNIEVTLNNNVVTITSTEDGDQTDIGDAKDVSGTIIPATSRIGTATITDGKISQGDNATVRVTGVVPEDVTTDYFYQIYRTGIISVSDGLTINDIDPGDEMNLVYEAGLTDAEIAAGEFEVTDTVPDSFRAGELPLYTNEVTGDGILQANEVPPIALDLELFRSYMFYANTKEKHKLTFTVVSVDDFISGSTRFIVGNADISRYYTFVGSAEVTDVTITGNPADGDSILLSSANNEREYYIWFDAIGDSSADPDVAGAVGYRIDISDTPSNDDIASRIEIALADNVDFSLLVASNVITFTHTNNGYTDGIRAGAALSNVTIALPSTTGTGELSGTDEGGDVLLSGLVSVGQSIDETARSLVKIISQDPESPVNAYYLSSGEELPGEILLEARSLEDIDFYIAIEEASNDAIGGEFTPELPLSKEIEEFTGTNTTTEIKLTGHGYTTGDEIFIGYYKDSTMPSDPDSFSGVYSITVIDVDNFSIEVATPNTVVSFVPAFSSIFKPDVQSDNQQLGNRVYYSKRNQPEAVPTVNFIDIGPQDEEIKRILALRDNLFVLKDDGVYVISGTSAPDWSVRLIDNTKIIAPDSAVVLNNQIYCLTEQGITRITDGGVAVISRGIENLVDGFTNSVSNFADNTFGISYENDRAYIMFAPTQDGDTSSTQAFRYNFFERTWTRWEYDATCGMVKENDSTLYLGNGDRNYISKERKNLDRTDHADRDFLTAINPAGISGTTIELASLADVKPADVLVQTQDVTIYYINYRLLKKMDLFDSGITKPVGSSMFDTYGVTTGDNLADKMQDINDYLRTLDSVNISAKAITQTTLRSDVETLVDELNTPATVTSIKTYKDPETVVYEAYITSTDPVRNQVVINRSRAFVEGAIQVHKHISADIEWNPQHFGDPSALKQVRYMTIMFDQNNFSEAIAKFSSDISQGKVEVPFPGKGISYWGDQYSAPNTYWGGIGNDVPFRNPVPRGKQKCRYITIGMEHNNGRESFRILGVSAVVRAISDRGYR